MPTPQWVDETGRRVTLGDRVGPPGGEGEIRRIHGQPGLVAKIYHQPADAAKTEKLGRLRSLAKPALTNIAAWPETLLFVAGDSRQVMGFVMPFREGRRVERLYSPRDRLKDFPKAGWDFLVHVARNCAAAFETLHEHGVLMADVNEGNVLVADDGLVRLIDCDSYQVNRSDGRALTCDVGVPLWTPPELQRRSLSGLVRTPDHDRFGLAMLVFHLLFMGRHPYVGVPVSKDAEDIQPDAAIARDQFAYGANHLALGVRPPPHVLIPTALPSFVGQLFERAFGPARTNALNGGRNRPSGREWADALGSLPIRRCTSNPLHAYPESAGACPWCRIHREGGPAFFNIVVASNAATAAQVEKLWRLIVGKPVIELKLRPLADYPVPALQPAPLPTGLQPVRTDFYHRFFTSLGANLVNPAYIQERARRKALVERTRLELDKALAAAAGMPVEYHRHLTAKRSELEGVYRQHLNLEIVRAEELRKLQLSKHDIMRNQFLDSCVITPNTISGIGSNRTAVLKSCGVESALDITPHLQVPGIGPSLLGGLLAWRRQMEARFVFKPEAALPANVIAALDQRQQTVRLELEARLRGGPVEIDRLTAHAQQALERLEVGIAALVRTHAQAIVDFQHLPEIAVAKQSVNRTTVALGLVAGVILLLVLASQNVPTTPTVTSASSPQVALPSPTVAASLSPTPTVQPESPLPTPKESPRATLFSVPPTPHPSPSIVSPLPTLPPITPVLKAEPLMYHVIGVSSTDTLNMRSGPGEIYPVVARLPHNAAAIQVVGVPQLNGPDAWVPIRIGTQTGWVIQRFLATQ